MRPARGPSDEVEGAKGQPRPTKDCASFSSAQRQIGGCSHSKEDTWGRFRAVGGDMTSATHA